MAAYQYPFQLPNRRGADFAQRTLLQLDREPPIVDNPDRLPKAAIVEEPNLFQPRYDSIAYAPGRSEAHVAALARIARAGEALDPVTIVAFGSRWYLVDGHHRLAAYGEAGWTADIPVRPLHSPLRGAARIAWAIEQSLADNKKDRLNMGTTDKVDAAWQAVAHGRDRSKADTVRVFGVSDGLVANMRRVRRDLEKLKVPATTFPRWRTAQSELRRLQGEEEAPRRDFEDAQRRKAAKGLAPVMQMHLSPGQLAEALEAFSPGIVEAMVAAQRLAGES